MPDDKNSTADLFNEFPPTPDKEWEDILRRDLKGADYKEKLKWESLEGIEALPFYRKEDLRKIAHLQKCLMPETPGNWTLSENIDASDPKEANSQAKNAVLNGAQSLRFTIRATLNDGALNGDIIGTQIHNLNDLQTLLNGIDCKKTEVIFDSGAHSIGMTGMLNAFLRHSDPVSFTLLFDPFTYLAEHGRLPMPEDDLNRVINLYSNTDGFNSLAADGSFYHNCGATIIQELGITLAIGSEHLARVDEKSRTEAANRFWMQLSAGSLYFPEIAKFRALRLLWNRVLDGYKIENSEPLTIHAITSQWNKSVADPHTNMLRATTEAMAAAIGGANRITVHPYNATFEQPTDLSKRVARNVSHILDEEAHLSKVHNPGDGSYYIEKLTDQIAQKAWAFFQLIEKQGGVVKALQANIIQEEVGKSSKEKDEALATRQMILTGVNNYPNSDEPLPDQLFRSTPTDSLRESDSKQKFEIGTDQLFESLSGAFQNGATVGDLIEHYLKLQKQLYPALRTYRAAEPFEQIRLNTQNFVKNRGSDVHVQLVPVGDKKWRKARASFSQNFLECAGFKTENPIGWDSIEEAVTELKESRSDIYVLCSSDKEYPELVSAFCTHFETEDAVTILAGNPNENRDSFEKDGVQFFIFSGCNMIELLSDIQEKIGITG